MDATSSLPGTRCVIGSIVLEASSNLESSPLAGADVLVTGGTGFIGSLLVRGLSSIGCHISLLVESESSFKSSEHTIHQGDLSSRNILVDAARDARVVYHLAAFTDPDAKSREDVKRCFTVNVEGTKNLLASLGPSTEHVVFFSTVYVFGYQNGEGIDEAYPANPSTPYGRSKLEVENRAYLLFHGPMSGVGEIGYWVGNYFRPQTPDLMWPADRSWFVAGDTDLDSTYLGGSSELIRELLADARVEAWPVSATDPIDAGSDLINREWPPPRL